MGQKTFFFYKAKYIKKRKRAQPIVHRTYTRESLRGRREARKKIRKTNYNRGKPTGCPSVKRKKKVMKNFLERSRQVFKASSITFPPNTPHKTQRNHLPNHRTPRATPRPPTGKQLPNRARHDPIQSQTAENSIPQGISHSAMKKKMIHRLPIRLAQPTSINHYHASPAKVWVGLLQSLLNGPKDLSVEKRIMAVLVSLKGLKGFGLCNGQAGHKLGLGFHLKPTRRMWPARHLKFSAVKLSAPSLAPEDALVASEAKPSALVRFAGSPVTSLALSSAVEATYSGVFYPQKMTWVLGFRRWSDRKMKWGLGLCQRKPLL
jgi:hypothetical protein